MARYIQSTGHAWPAAADYIARRIRAAFAAGFTPKGMRAFGDSAPRARDFFAHSNFLELSLRMLRLPVQTWVHPMKETGIHPLVTGKFAGDDTAVSLLGRSRRKRTRSTSRARQRRRSQMSRRSCRQANSAHLDSGCLDKFG